MEAIRVRVKRMGNDPSTERVRGYINDTRVREGQIFEIPSDTNEVDVKHRDGTVTRETRYKFFSARIMEAIDSSDNVIEGFQHSWTEKDKVEVKPDVEVAESVVDTKEAEEKVPVAEESSEDYKI